MGTSAIIALIISAIAGIAGGIATYASQNKTNNVNKQEYEDWKSYNTPSAQMDRLSDAGLNPYMVNGVSNTLSQPFQVGQSANLAGLFDNLSRSAGQAVNYIPKAESNAIRRDSVQVQRDKLEFEKTFGELKKDMMRNAIKRGDAQAAMFWSSVNQKDIVSNYLKRSMPFRIGSSIYDYLLKQQTYGFNELMNPQVLDWYEPMMKARFNQITANTRHLGWYENYLMDNFLFNKDKFNRSMALNWRKYFQGVNQFDQEMALKNNRLALSGLYYNLAQRKFFADVLFRGLDNFYRFTPSYKSLTKRQPGSFSQTIFEQNYK